MSLSWLADREIRFIEIPSKFYGKIKVTEELLRDMTASRVSCGLFDKIMQGLQSETEADEPLIVGERRGV